MKNKDNPIPSFDKEEISFIINLLKQSVPIGTKLAFTKQAKIISKLQNGVETNKEQSKCDICKGNIQINKICNCPDTEH